MFTLPESSRAARSTVPTWRTCEHCDELFPALPGQYACRDCERPEPTLTDRCDAAHPEDKSPCDGPPDSVRVVDQVGDELRGCVRHASIVLASVEGSRANPGSVAGAAIEAYTRSQLLDPFAFDPDEGWPAAHPSGGAW